jgi:hypothetical protein
MIRYAWLAALPATALALAACASTPSNPPSSAGMATPSARTAMQTCKQQYDAWKTGPARTRADSIEADLNKVQSAANAEDVPRLNSALKAAGRDAAALDAYPMPACADPKGYWAQILGYVQAAGDNAGTSSGLSGLILAMAPLQKIQGVQAKLTAELDKDAAEAK